MLRQVEMLKKYLTDLVEDKLIDAFNSENWIYDLQRGLEDGGAGKTVNCIFLFERVNPPEQGTEKFNKAIS